MSNLSGSVGEGPGGLGGGPGRSVDTTGYGFGVVETGTRNQPGTGFDERGNVKTQFGKWGIGYDPVSGTATQGTTMGYGFPGEGLDAIAGGEGLDAIAGGEGLDAIAGGMQPGMSLESGGLADLSAAAAGHSTPATYEQSGQGIAEATEAGAFLRTHTDDRTGREAEAWRDRREHDPEREGLERPSGHHRQEE